MVLASGDIIFFLSVAAIRWLYLLHKSNQESLDELVALKSVFIRVSYSGVEKVPELTRPLSGKRCPKWSFFIVQTVGVMSVYLMLMVLAWGMQSKSEGKATGERAGVRAEAVNISSGEKLPGVQHSDGSLCNLVDRETIAKILDLTPELVEKLEKESELPALDLSPPRWRGTRLIRYDPAMVLDWARRRNHASDTKRFK